MSHLPITTTMMGQAWTVWWCLPPTQDLFSKLIFIFVWHLHEYAFLFNLIFFFSFFGFYFLLRLSLWHGTFFFFFMFSLAFSHLLSLAHTFYLSQKSKLRKQKCNQLVPNIIKCLKVNKNKNVFCWWRGHWEFNLWPKVGGGGIWTLKCEKKMSKLFFLAIHSNWLKYFSPWHT